MNNFTKEEITRIKELAEIDKNYFKIDNAIYTKATNILEEMNKYDDRLRLVYTFNQEWSLEDLT
jgi:hypothetical protein